MNVAIPFYKFKSIIEKDDYSTNSFDFKYLILKQVETFKKKIREYIIDRCKEHKIIDLENEKDTKMEIVKSSYDVIFNPFYNVKVGDRYEIQIRTDILIKTSLLERIFDNVQDNLKNKDFVHINIVYKTVSVNKRGQVLLSKFEKFSQALLNKATGDSFVIYIARKYKTKTHIIDNCFGLCAVSNEVNMENNIKELECALISKNACKKNNILDDKLDHINPLSYKRKFKYVLKKEFDLKNMDIHDLIKKTIFLDFEFIPDLVGNFDTFPKTSRKSIVFMIGIGFMENNEWVYKDYTTSELSENDEKKIINNWLKDMKRLNENGYKYIMHWSKAEKTYLSKDIVYYLEKAFSFIDLMDVFKKCQSQDLKFKSLSLKHISKVFNRFNLVNLKWEDNISDGKSAMTETLFCDLLLQNKKRQKEKKLIDFDSIKNVVKYNEIDVKIMFLILERMTR